MLNRQDLSADYYIHVCFPAGAGRVRSSRFQPPSSHLSTGLDGLPISLVPRFRHTRTLCPSLPPPHFYFLSFPRSPSPSPLLLPPPDGAPESPPQSHLPLFGLSAIGPNGSSPGSTALITAVDRPDPYGRPLFVQLWGGGNCLAQALWEVRETRTKEELGKFLGKLRVYAISDQDDTGPWMRREFPGLSYVSSHG